MDGKYIIIDSNFYDYNDVVVVIVVGVDDNIVIFVKFIIEREPRDTHNFESANGRALLSDKKYNRIDFHYIIICTAAGAANNEGALLCAWRRARRVATKKTHAHTADS